MVVAVAFVGTVFNAEATVIWSKAFTDVSDWEVIYDPSASASLTSDGLQGSFSVGAGNSQAAFGPTVGLSPLTAFDPAAASKYSMDFTVNNLTLSTSYDIRLDEFDSNTNYLGTVFNVFPQGTFTGTTNNIALGAFSFNPDAIFVLPKVTVFTGNPNQTVNFARMDIAVVPEPSVMLLFVIGFGVIGFKRFKTPSATRPAAHRRHAG
jgi:hypothetical protein